MLAECGELARKLDAYGVAREPARGGEAGMAGALATTSGSSSRCSTGRNSRRVSGNSPNAAPLSVGEGQLLEQKSKNCVIVNLTEKDSEEATALADRNLVNSILARGRFPCS